MHLKSSKPRSLPTTPTTLTALITPTTPTTPITPLTPLTPLTPILTTQKCRNTHPTTYTHYTGSNQPPSLPPHDISCLGMDTSPTREGLPHQKTTAQGAPPLKNNSGVLMHSNIIATSKKHPKRLSSASLSILSNKLPHRMLMRKRKDMAEQTQTKNCSLWDPHIDTFEILRAKITGITQTMQAFHIHELLRDGPSKEEWKHSLVETAPDTLGAESTWTATTTTTTTSTTSTHPSEATDISPCTSTSRPSQRTAWRNT
ncbi:hypothetical protein BDF14DRAFT_1880700 [Spinellus fusiger]|nr:hypothetical protein BDF14DRAFT_1880700 [Spinellus fusiger]